MKHKTKEGCWQYTSGKIIRKNNNEIIATINRNYCNFDYSFFIKNNQEWLQTGSTYMSQTFVNCDTGEVYDNTDKLKMSEEYRIGISFCWVKSEISLDGNTLAVYGCHWACPYQYKFFDVTDISKGWFELKIEEPLVVNDNDELTCENNIWIFKNISSYYKLGEKLIEVYSFEYDNILDDKGSDFFQDENYVEIVTKIIKYERNMDTMVIIDENIVNNFMEKN